MAVDLGRAVLPTGVKGAIIHDDPDGCGFWSGGVFRREPVMAVESLKGWVVAESQPRQPTLQEQLGPILPDWVFAADHVSFKPGFSLVGLLYMRLIRHLNPVHGMAVKGRFGITEKLSIADAYEVTHDGAPMIAVIAVKNDDIAIIYDDNKLFPSDSLLVKLEALKG